MKCSKKQIKIVLICALLVFFTFTYVNRYKMVNREMQSPLIEEYHMGEEVEMQKNILINYTMEGYSIKVNQAEVLSYEAFLNKYNAKDEYTHVPDKVYDVEVTVKNIHADKDTGINLTEFYVQGLAVCAGVDVNLCDIANPDLDGAYAIALRENSEKTIHLPFALYEENFRADIWNNLEDFDMDFVATLYPVKKIIELL